MKYRVLKDRRRRLLHSLFERRRIVLRALRETTALPATIRGQAYRALLLLPRDSSPTRLRNRCTLTGRSRAILRRFGLSRLIFRRFASEGKIVGRKKANWLFYIFLLKMFVFFCETFSSKLNVLYIDGSNF
jgi:small subunit ribosomal protein S14